MKKYLFALLSLALLIPQNALAETSADFNPLTKEVTFYSDSILDCDSAAEIYYLQTYIMTAPGPYYASPDTGMPIPEGAWWSVYGGGSFIAPYTDVFDGNQLAPGTYYAFVTCIDTQNNPTEYVPAHTPIEFTIE